MLRLLPLVVALLALPSPLALADWPAWRGPTGQGFSDDKNVPLTWSDTENVKWKIELAHQGNSTPVIWGDKIFMTQADKDGKTRSLICFARDGGKLLWQKDVTYEEKERNWNPNWYCNASPMTDGQRVVVSFGSAGVYCYDFDGKELWKRTDLGKWEHAFGNAASPVLYNDLAIQWCGPNDKGRNFLLAMNKQTGETVWEVDEKNGSWGTPLIAKIDGKDQLLLSTVPHLKGFEPQTGKELWFCEGLNKYVYTSPLYGNGHAIAMSGYTGAGFGVKLGGSGDITADRLWLHPVNIQRVGSGMLIGDHVYMVEENTVPHCYDVKTGEEVWNVGKRPGGTTWGSMVCAEGRLYILMRDGSTLVLAANPKYEVLATNSLGKGEQTNSSVAISNGEIFLRTFKHLYCIAKPK
ncbi:outer membrane biogenesis protein BamB [Anatilimnocola aggregata]|uniref:Outer membrane biogenesis protein BamB n=1 Tax=Anatilimnocola aggregata TaxID=2528021 RepID=A0A517YCC7_9BACT|nr:PQQ-binding-like beta-propeller repeat protein [Anatilimnocola aggregata]QDU27896.1 outer membrane biogenesis protein BamB [Anatilimnocola aggregata]